MKTSEILKAAKAKIADPANWIKGDSARNRDGWSVPAASDSAVCWCAIGAIWAVVEPTDKVTQTQAEKLLSTRGDGEGIGTWNDAPTTTHFDVMRRFDLAIAQAEVNELKGKD